jgi:hypothetical protein
MFFYALYQNNVAEIKTLLLEHDPSEQNQDAIRIAVNRSHYINNLEIINLLLSDPRVDASIEDNILFRISSHSNKPWTASLMKRLFQDSRVNPYCSDQLGFRNACRYGNEELVQWFLSLPDTDASIHDHFPIRVASAKGHLEIVRLLLQRKDVNPNFYDCYPLRFNLERGNEAMVRLLLSDSRVELTYLSYCTLSNPTRSFMQLISCFQDAESWIFLPSSICKWNQAIRLLQYRDIYHVNILPFQTYFVQQLEKSIMLTSLPSSILFCIILFL